jgi:hypothetical protein
VKAYHFAYGPANGEKGYSPANGEKGHGPANGEKGGAAAGVPAPRSHGGVVPRLGSTVMATSESGAVLESNRPR